MTNPRQAPDSELVLVARLAAHTSWAQHRRPDRANRARTSSPRR
jgi:hypothetical protein